MEHCFRKTVLARQASDSAIFKGVRWNAVMRQWHISIGDDQAKYRSIGFCPDKLAAARIHDAVARAQSSEMEINFPTAEEDQRAVAWSLECVLRDVSAISLCSYKVDRPAH
jgi:hypothetical protein